MNILYHINSLKYYSIFSEWTNTHNRNETLMHHTEQKKPNTRKHMIAFIWNSQKGKTNQQWKKAQNYWRERLPKEQNGTFRIIDMFLYLDCDDVSMGIHTCWNSIELYALNGYVLLYTDYIKKVILKRIKWSNIYKVLSLVTVA